MDPLLYITLNGLLEQDHCPCPTQEEKEEGNQNAYVLEIQWKELNLALGNKQVGGTLFQILALIKMQTYLLLPQQYCENYAETTPVPQVYHYFCSIAGCANIMG